MKFPGEKSPGLIEARPPRRRRPGRAGSRFRGRNPPASLKLEDSSDDRLPVRSEFPGEKSPGLIEAPPTLCWPLSRLLPFPGEKSPGLIEASVTVRPYCLHLSWFPGEKSPGLIEATTPRQSRRTFYCFRGRNPPASLKRIMPVDGLTQRTEFPGEKSPGLIEACTRPRESSHSLLRFPGEKSPGLIEARARTRSVVIISSFPGEKSPGLIEARMGPMKKRHVAIGVSGGEIPRPH